jgi:hypothetical protein
MDGHVGSSPKLWNCYQMIRHVTAVTRQTIGDVPQTVLKIWFIKDEWGHLRFDVIGFMNEQLWRFACQYLSHLWTEMCQIWFYKYVHRILQENTVISIVDDVVCILHNAQSCLIVLCEITFVQINLKYISKVLIYIQCAYKTPNTTSDAFITRNTIIVDTHVLTCEV